MWSLPSAPVPCSALATFASSNLPSSLLPRPLHLLPLPEARMLPPPHPQDQLHFIIQVPASCLSL